MELSAKESKVINAASQSIQIIKSADQRKVFNIPLASGSGFKTKPTTRSQSVPNKQQANQSRKLCNRCGKRFHNELYCPARDWNCFACGRAGHTSVVRAHLVVNKGEPLIQFVIHF